MVLKIDWNTLPTKRKVGGYSVTTKGYNRDDAYNREYNKYSNNTFNDIVKKEVVKLNDDEFDTWYNEQKNRNWKVDDKKLVY